MRRMFYLLAALVVALGAPSAQAGDAAEAEVLGFDGGLFAFEEYGVQDGSGFPYANVYVVDTVTDEWVDGTPVRVLLEDGGATLAEALAEAHARLEERFGDAFDPGSATVLAHSPLGEVETDPARLSFAPVLPALPLGNHAPRYVARLEIYHAETQTENCVAYIGDRPMGFRLMIERQGGRSTVLSDDDIVPRSRGCPITYRIDRIVVPDGYPPDRVAVLVSVFAPGYEGPQRRFIAVTGRLPG